MLIAMMANTYQVVSETQKEWLRQWAKIILVIEQTVTTSERKKQLINYSRPMKDGRRALEKEKEEIQEQKEEIKNRHISIVQKNLSDRQAKAL
ncbi:DgyrCDS13868 [Dimorphilus gyrociliatus]|uniref:DgyrCDS13868 n=1 Tax=Dimorphilus gyrociliatus TaxID=2664684 RepID=A0A7I8WBX3_9ANNE|nr:DgyrCDS13868 [Dimorphilus gyrociliatus]